MEKVKQQVAKGEGKMASTKKGSATRKTTKNRLFTLADVVKPEGDEAIRIGREEFTNVEMSLVELMATLAVEEGVKVTCSWEHYKPKGKSGEFRKDVCAMKSLLSKRYKEAGIIRGEPEYKATSKCVDGVVYILRIE